MKTPNEDKLKELEEYWDNFLKDIPRLHNLLDRHSPVDRFLEKLKEMGELEDGS